MSEHLNQRIEEILGKEYISSPNTVRRYSIDDLIPKTVVFPPDRKSICKILSTASELKKTVIPWGGGTQMILGNPPRSADIVIGLKHLNKVISHEPAELTATVEAGITLKSFQYQLKKHGQFLPLETPIPERATIGGILSTNSSGPSRLSYGTPHDWLIGIRVVDATGISTKAGGKVVKNVTGYDLNKLYVGSLGTLAIIVEATFKVTPIPMARQTLLCGYHTLDSTIKATSQLLNLPFQVESMIVIDMETINHLHKITIDQIFNFNVLVMLSGPPLALKRKVRETTQVMGRPINVKPLTLDQSKEFWQSITDLGWSNEDTPHLTMKVTVLLSQVARLLLSVISDKHSKFRRGFTAEVGSGVIRIFWWKDNGQTLELKEARQIVIRIRELAQQMGGYAIIETCPIYLKREFDVWGNAPPTIDLMKRIKSKYDPDGLLNPGRFLGDI